MMIDCDSCAVRGPACGDCVVTVLLGGPPAELDGSPPSVPAFDLDGPEQAAIAVLAGSGLVPPLRLVPVERDETPDGDDVSPGRRGAGGRRPHREAG